MNFLSLDVGTTCCKCQLFTEKGEILFYRAQEYALKKANDSIYVDADAIRRNVEELIVSAAKIAAVNSISVSSFGEAFVLLDEQDNILFDPMLYTDPRGEKQAQVIRNAFDETFLYQTTGVLPHAMYSVSKLLWIKENHPNIYAKANKLLLLGDYIGYLLTGNRVIDYSLAARTGVFNIRKKCFATDILSVFGIDPALFSKPRPTGCVVGTITPTLITQLGLAENCKLVLGSHDQICATIGAGILHKGEAADGMGTVECITAVFENPPENLEFGKMGYPTVPFISDNLYCTYILNYSSGSLVNWWRKDVLHGYSGEKDNFFSYIEESLPGAPTNLLCLPYFAGAATPYQDSDAKGCLFGLTLQTTDADIYRSLLESTSLEMRLNLETVKNFGITIENAVATGGGANSLAWLQIKSDITGLTLRTLRSSEGGLCGVAMLQAVAMGTAKDLEEAKNIFVQYVNEVTPTTAWKREYEKTYEKYKKLYKTMKEFY
ncbi:MAG: hypothetical protein IJZ32_02050 [Clostridia bacterium]|nr:hypothetical protein [Clostridia bacterium]